jgi:hypothetical protein
MPPAREALPFPALLWYRLCSYSHRIYSSIALKTYKMPKITATIRIKEPPLFSIISNENKL